MRYKIEVMANSGVNGLRTGPKRSCRIVEEGDGNMFALMVFRYAGYIINDLGDLFVARINLDTMKKLSGKYKQVFYSANGGRDGIDYSHNYTGIFNLTVDMIDYVVWPEDTIFTIIYKKL